MPTQLEFRAGVEACYRRGNGLEAITMIASQPQGNRTL